MTAILIDPGCRTAKGALSNEPEFVAKIAEGFEVFTLRQGVYFRVTPDPDRIDGLKYSAMAKKPEGL